MKKQNEKYAFSLAEAMITLLIVCLITLASIPVLTKKKRDQSTHANGMWMCTKNSKGEYVVYSSSSPSGDVKQPDSWKLSKNNDKCVFTPPMNAKNFVVTMVGGGGGGANGVSKQVDYLDKDNTSKRIDEDGIYRLAVVGAGGGGHGSDDSGDGYNGIGGQGGGGAVWMGAIKLFKGDTITSHIGTGGNGCKDGNKKAKWCNKGNPTIFKINETEFITAGGGGAGQSTQDGHRPKKGNGGVGGLIGTVNSTFASIVQSNPAPISIDGGFAVQFRHCGYVASNGGGRCEYISPNRTYSISSSQDGRIQNEETELIIEKHAGYTSSDHKICVGIHNGFKLGDFYNNQDDNEYGLGGLGCRFKDSTGFNGKDGIVRVWQVIQNPGKGGSASVPIYYSIPTIKGRAEITIGNGGDANKNGEISTLTIINNSGKEERTYKSNIGLAGGLGEPVSEEFVNGGIGENSQVINIGGGNGGICQGAHYETVKVEKSYEAVNTDVCLLAMYNMGPTIKAQTSEDGASSYCPLNKTSDVPGLCVGCYAGDNTAEECKYKMDDETGQLVPSGALATQGYIALENEYDDYTQPHSYDNLFNFINARNQSHGLYVFETGEWDVEQSKNIVGHKEPVSDDYECLSYPTETRYKTVIERRLVAAGCEKASDGAFFGAGGGGGGSSNQLDIFGEGGKGAPGGVLIEW